MGKRLSKKQIKKRIDRACHFCGESDYDLLDCHRIVEGKDGGKYVDGNMVTACSKCHRKLHSGRIKILGRHYTTAGIYVLNYIEDDEEKWN
jgi:5-methylcytosine-specific restriction endonuclease McrA